MFLIVYYLIVSALAAKCTQDTNTANCAQGKCEKLGSKEICTQCNKGKVPINGECKAHDDATVVTGTGAGCQKTGGAAVDENSVICEKCTKANYFLFMGGCYKADTEPGQTICQAAGSEGKCTTCKADTKYIFQNPANPSTLGSECILCWDTTGANEVVGVENCATCAAPSKAPGVATCSKCATGALYTPSEGATSCLATCPEGYFEHTASDTKKTCQSCSGKNADLNPAATGVTGCVKCTYDNTKVTCTKCETGKYLKTAGDSTSCVEASQCGSGFFPKTDDKAGNKCVPCGEAGSGGINNCAECTAPGEGKTKPTCTKCTDKYLKTAADGTTTCVEQGECTSDSFPVENTSAGNKCLSCGDAQGAADTAGGIWKGVTGCAKCTKPATANSPATCSECGSGYKLEGEACVPAGTNLSTGAIAGISVAAVVVVGGLVGFLCWWFICRGKA